MRTGNTPCGIALPPDMIEQTGVMDHLREYVARVEALGVYDSVWVTESILGKVLVLEPISFLSYVTALTTRVRLGVSVMLLTLRNPIQLAKAVATLDFMSDGRFNFGIGMGHGQEATFGYARERRAARFEESLAVMKKLWAEEDVDFAGDFWQFKGINVVPKPVQEPHPPLWFGARQPAALRRAVKLGDAFMGAGSSSSADFASQVQQLRQFMEEEGRDPDTLLISKRVYLAVDEDKERAEARLRSWFGYHYGQAEMGSRVSIWGSQAECLDKLGELVQAGAQHLLLNPVFDEREHLELLAAEVVPHL
ncbi:MAG: LLM class flavin-dependent oxidoreductase [Anaerolineales bacterium]|nr:LLM class flavin-dependent oxidoreductase [Anaerolineales bacterium]